MKLDRLFIGTLLISSITFPATLPELKFLLFGGSLLFSFRGFFLGKIKINKLVFLMSIFFGAVGFAYSVYGYIVDAPGALRVMTVMVAYPILFPLIVAGYKETDADSLFRLFLTASWLLIFVNIFYLVSGLFLADNYFIRFIKYIYEDYAVIDSGEEYFKYTIPNISSLVFLLPFLISAFFFTKRQSLKVELFFLVLAMLLLTVLSGRRALFLAAITGPLICYFITFNVKRYQGATSSFLVKASYFVAFICIVGIFVFYYNYMDGLILQINSIFDFGGNSSNIERALQFNSLTKGIVEKPFFGHGAGAAAEYSRSNEQPWAYELSYVAFIFQYGGIGFLIYTLGILLLLYGLYMAVKNNNDSIFEYCFISGFSAFLIANATNPYLAKFDYMWVIFIPLGILSFNLRKV